MICRGCIAALSILPPMLALDTSDTGESTVAYFGDARIETAGGRR